MEQLKTPWELFGIECHQGWESIIAPLFDYVEKYNKEHTDSQIYIDQVKEKFGGLRFYWGGENLSEEISNEFFNMVLEAERKSYHVCEMCGTTENVGLLNIHGWYYTRCKDCAQNIVNARQLMGTFKTDDNIVDLCPVN